MRACVLACVYAFVRTCVQRCVRACVRACICSCVRARGRTHRRASERVSERACVHVQAFVHACGNVDELIFQFRGGVSAFDGGVQVHVRVCACVHMCILAIVRVRACVGACVCMIAAFYEGMLGVT